MNHSTLPLHQPRLAGQYLGLSPAFMPLAGRHSPLSTMLLEPGFGMPLSPAALSLQQSMLQSTLLNDLKTLQELGNLQRSAIYAKKAEKLVTKASVSSVKKNMLRPTASKPGRGPLPPPPSLVSMKQWQKIKLQLDTNKPRYNPAA